MENKNEEYMKYIESTSKIDPIPHTEYKVQPDVNVDEVWDKMLNFLVWHYIDDKNWIFRGHRRETNGLKSTLDRQINKRKNVNIIQEDAEDYLLKQFKRAAHHFLNCSMVPNNDDILEWLSLMRHYGAPTRLLDFTRSPYIACFFALEESAVETKENGNDDTKRAIWAINTQWLVDISFPYIKEKFPIQNDLTKDKLQNADFISQNFEIIFMKNTMPFILPIEPKRANARLLI